uniref:Probable ribonuclease ZC3H12D n=1 Tax=Cacopsylla melanoneura TaxID=428564 RepID=A0A8D8LU14_9HEMI
MTSREIKKFTPYKRIVRGSDISSPNKPNQEPVSSENQYQVIETQAPHPQDSHSQDKVRVKMSRKSKSEKRSKTLDKEQSLSNVLIEECSTSGEDNSSLFSPPLEKRQKLDETIVPNTTDETTNSNPVGSSCVPSTSRGANQQALFGCPVDGLSKGGRVRQGTTSVFTSSVQQREDSNIYNPAGDSSKEKKSGLRPIVIDGCNVAMEHGKVVGPNSQFNFSGRGVQIVVDYFRKRGHKEIHVFIPHHKVSERSTSNPEILEQLKTDGILTLTPSRFVEGKLQVAYDDRYIVQTAAELGGVIVSNDRYRDLMQENDKWKATIEQRLLMFNFVKDMLMFPQDPLGREGPTLDQFLKFPG